MTTITVEHLLAIHRRLTAGTRLEHVGGKVRTVQNWIGGSDATSRTVCGLNRA